MALWKPFRGKRSDLDSVEKHDGWIYFTTDDASLFFDYVDANGVLQRKQINASIIARLEALEKIIYGSMPMVEYEGADMLDAGLITSENVSEYRFIDLGAII